MATSSKKPSKPQATDLQAQRQTVHDLRQQIATSEDNLKTVSLEAQRIRLGGHNIHDKTMNVDALSKIMRDYPTPETSKLAESFERLNVHPVQHELARLRAQLQGELVILERLEREHRASNAESMLAEALDRHHEAMQAHGQAKAQHEAVEKRLAAARMARLDNERIKREHDQACVQAIADGTEPPALVLNDHEDVSQLEAAARLTASKVREAGDAAHTAEKVVKGLQDAIAGQRAAELLELIKTEAHDRGVPLARLRDAIVELAGPTLAHQLDGDELYRARRELAQLRPEVEKLRSDNQALRDGVVQLTRSPYR